MAQTYHRIVSLVPSLTELLIDLGLKDRLVGRTRFCIHPEKEVNDIPIVGGTKNPRVDKILDLRPDYIVANKEENRKEDIQQLQDSCTVNVTDIDTIEDALLTMQQLGQSLEVEQPARKLAKEISSCLEQRPDERQLKTAYFIWRDPWMTIGRDTYIHNVMDYWGLDNIFGYKKRYPVISLKELAKHQPELVLLSSEPYPFKEKHLPIIKKACPQARVLLVEGEWFSWYGSHMLHAFGRLNVWRRAIA